MSRQAQKRSNSIRSQVRREFIRMVDAGVLGEEGSGSTFVRKYLLRYVVDRGGKPSSAPGEYHSVQKELIASGVLVKTGRGKMVRADHAVNESRPQYTPADTLAALQVM